MKKPLSDIQWARICLNTMLGVVVLVFVWLSVTYVKLLVNDTEGWLNMSNRNQFYNDTVYGDRGNIYDCQGRLVQATFPYYNVVMDMRVEFLHNTYKPPKNSKAVNTDSLSNYEVYADSVCVAVADYFKQYTHAELRKKMDAAFKAREYRFKIVEGKLTHKQLKALQAMPLLNQSRLHSGLVVEPYENRENLYDSLAYRVVGAVFGDRTKKKSGEYGRFGIEQYFNEELAGVPGIEEHRAGSDARPLVRPVDGLDVVMTIDMDIQDKSESLLKNTFANSHGNVACMMVMETATGEIKSMVNLTKDSATGKVIQGYENYCVSYIAEPGSTIKTIAMLAMLEDGKCDLDKNYFVNGGEIVVARKKITDTHTHSDYLKPHDILVCSSNCGMSRIAIDGYGNNRKGWSDFYDALMDMRFTHEIGIELGKSDIEYKPRVKDPETYKKWSLTTMPSMAYGYEIMMTPIYTLNFYNAVANGGYYVKPHVVRELRRGGEVVKDFSVKPERHRIASKKNIETIQSFLLDVVESPNGTGYDYVRNDQVKIAGKTGTARRVRRDENGAYRYLVTFVGYFPADNPKYTVIVQMANNLGSEGAGSRCGSVVRDIAKYLMINY